MSTIGSLLAMFFPLYILLYIANVGERLRQSALGTTEQINSDAEGGPSEDADTAPPQARNPHQAPILFCYLLLGFGFAAALFLGLVLHAFTFVLPTNGAGLSDVDSALPPGLAFSFDSLPIIALGIWLPGLGGLLSLLRPVRSQLARVIAIDPDNPVHTVALAFVMLVIVNLMITVGVGLGNLAGLMEDGLGDTTQAAITLWVQQILMAIMAFIGVGWLARRSLPAAVQRLGLERPTVRQLLIGSGLGVLMVPAVLISTYLASLVGLGVDPDVERLTEQMIGPLLESPLLGVLTIGLAAALGEELLFRGALQPRFGVVFTALIFALVHSNYGISISTLIVFLLGLLLGWVRIRYNTSTAMALHAVYNMTLSALAILGASFLEF
jgi:membrane protease YdiL (CAAX protease family)